MLYPAELRGRSGLGITMAVRRGELVLCAGLFALFWCKAEGLWKTSSATHHRDGMGVCRTARARCRTVSKLLSVRAQLRLGCSHLGHHICELWTIVDHKSRPNTDDAPVPPHSRRSLSAWVAGTFSLS